LHHRGFTSSALLVTGLAVELSKNMVPELSSMFLEGANNPLTLPWPSAPYIPLLTTPPGWTTILIYMICRPHLTAVIKRNCYSLWIPKAGSIVCLKFYFFWVAVQRGLSLVHFVHNCCLQNEIVFVIIIVTIFRVNIDFYSIRAVQGALDIVWIPTKWIAVPVQDVITSLLRLWVIMPLTSWAAIVEASWHEITTAAFY